MNSAQDYEKLVNELQNYKKQCSSQKLAHQTTIDQLQTSYNLNQQLQQVIRSQTSTINSMHKQLAQKNNKLAQMSEKYQMQLVELKQFINMKDRELQGMRGTLIVTDYDMIRLRVISQLQLVHKEQLQQLNRQIQRLNKIWANQKQEKQIINQKFLHIKKQMQKVIEKYEQQLEQKERKHIRQIHRANDKVQLQRMSRKQAERQSQINQKKLQNLQQRYDSEISMKYNTNTTKIRYQYEEPRQQNRYQKQDQILSLKQTIQSKNQQIQSVKRKLEKQSTKYQQIISDLEYKLKQTKNSYIQYNEHLKIIRDKEKQFQANIQTYEKKIKVLKQQHSEQIKRINRQNSRRQEDYKQKYKKQKQNYTVNINKLAQNNDNQKLSLAEKTRLLQKIRTLQQEIANLNKQLLERKRAEKISKATDRSDSTDIYKNKLQEANKKIVNLLLEKVTLKTQIIKYTKT